MKFMFSLSSIVLQHRPCQRCPRGPLYLRDSSRRPWRRQSAELAVFFRTHATSVPSCYLHPLYSSFNCLPIFNPSSSSERRRVEKCTFDYDCSFCWRCVSLSPCRKADSGRKMIHLLRSPLLSLLASTKYSSFPSYSSLFLPTVTLDIHFLW